MIHTVKGFGIVNKAEINVFLELSCFFYDPADVASGNLLYNACSSNQVLCDYLEGWDEVGGGRDVQESGDMCISNSCLCVAETNTIL